MLKQNYAVIGGMTEHRYLVFCVKQGVYCNNNNHGIEMSEQGDYTDISRRCMRSLDYKEYERIVVLLWISP